MSTAIMAGIVAKGIGVLLAIVGFGFVLGVIATLMITSRIRRFRR
jgi:hypothetical protein